MTKSFEIEVTKELEILCDIYQTTPTEVLQDFVNKVVVEVITEPSFIPALNFLIIVRDGEVPV